MELAPRLEKHRVAFLVIDMQERFRELVALAADAASSRRPRDREIALARMRDSGVQVMSTEMVLFEILRADGDGRLPRGRRE